MIDRAGILMDNGARIACHRVEGMNDNMSHSHYHTYFELYFLEGGARHHIMQDPVSYTHLDVYKRQDI